MLSKVASQCGACIGSCLKKYENASPLTKGIVDGVVIGTGYAISTAVIHVAPIAGQSVVESVISAAINSVAPIALFGQGVVGSLVFHNTGMDPSYSVGVLTSNIAVAAAKASILGFGASTGFALASAGALSSVAMRAFGMLKAKSA